MKIALQPTKATACYVTSVLLVAALNVCADTQWKTGYELYDPKIEIETVYVGPSHGSSIAYFDGKWIAMWDSGSEKYGQVIWQSTSTDLKSWSVPVQAFSSSIGSENPVEITATTKLWQPALLVVGDRLWCLWSSSGHGVYFSTLRGADHKWVIKHLTNHVVFDDRPADRWSPFVSNGGLQTSDGRVFFPLTLMLVGDKSPDFWSSEKKDSVIFTEDNGVTWSVSSGISCGASHTECWEATIWEPEAGVLNLISRHNRKASELNPIENLKFTHTTLQNIDKWHDKTSIPIESAMSRPHVVKKGIRNFLIQNDSHVSKLPDGSVLVNRKNLTMFFNRGDNYDFVAGLNFYFTEDFVGKYPLVDYPQMTIKGEAGVVTFTTKQSPTYWKTMVAKIEPLPNDKKRYVFPRKARGMVETTTLGTRQAIRFRDNYSSAGIDIDSNAVAHEKVVISFDFKAETNDRQSVISFGYPTVTFYAENGRAKLGAGNTATLIDCGSIANWTPVEFESGVGRTSLKLHNSETPSCFVDFAPDAGRTMYFGRNYYNGAKPTTGASFVVDLYSIKTAIRND